MGGILCFKQKTAYEMRISDWGSDVGSSDLPTMSKGMETMPGSCRLGSGKGKSNMAESAQILGPFVKDAPVTSSRSPARPVAVIILAAGQGTRMKSARHKVLHPIAGRPMLPHLLASVAELQPERPVVVVGAGREQVEMAVAGSGAASAVPMGRACGR